MYNLSVTRVNIHTHDTGATAPVLVHLRTLHTFNTQPPVN